MKLLITLVLASMLVLKTAEGADVALDGDCSADGAICSVANSECTGNPKTCACQADYVKKDAACIPKDCANDGDCTSGFCKTKKCAAKIALGVVCADGDKCSDAKAECKADTDKTKKCLCMENYEKEENGGTCKLKNGQTCSANSECAKGTCPTDIKKCGKAKDAACDKNEECASGNCKADSDSKKKCADGASAIVASVLLMVSALVTSRFL